MAPTPQDILAESQGTTPVTPTFVSTTPSVAAPNALATPSPDMSAVNNAGVSPSLADQLTKIGYRVRPAGTAATAARNADALAASNPAPSKPGAWSKALVGGMQSAIAGLGDAGAVGKVPEGAGALYGVSKALEARNTRLAAQKAQADREKQQKFENQMATNRDKRAQEQADYETFARQIQTEHSIREMDQEDQDHMAALADKHIKANEASGGRLIQGGMTSDELQAYAKANHASPDDPNGTHWLSQQPKYQDGWETVYGIDGNPKMKTDKWGHEIGEQRRQTYALMTWGDPRTVDKDFADEAAKYDPAHPIQEGQVLLPQQARSIETQITLGQAQEIATKKLLVDAGQVDANLDKLKQNKDFQAAMPIWLHWMNDAKGDPGLAMHNLEVHATDIDPNTGKPNPEAVAQYQMVLRGMGQEIVKTELDNYENTEKINAKEQADKSAKNPQPTGNTDLTGDAYLQSVSADPNGGKGEANLIKAIANAQYPIQNWSYILARANSPIAKEVSTYDPNFNGPLLQDFPNHYKDFLDGPSSQLLLAGGTAVDALDALKNIQDQSPIIAGTPEFLIPGTKSYKQYKNQFANTVGEIAKYLYGPGKPTDSDIKQISEGLSVRIPNQVDAAIQTQAAALQKRFGEIQQKWVNGLPNQTWVQKYQMPGLRPDTMRTLQRLAGPENPAQPGYNPNAPVQNPTNPITPNYNQTTQVPSKNTAPPKIDPEQLKVLHVNASTVHYNPQTQQSIGWNGTSYIDLATGQPYKGNQ